MLIRRNVESQVDVSCGLCPIRHSIFKLVHFFCLAQIIPSLLIVFSLGEPNGYEDRGQKASD